MPVGVPYEMVTCWIDTLP